MTITSLNDLKALEYMKGKDEERTTPITFVCEACGNEFTYYVRSMWNKKALLCSVCSVKKAKAAHSKERREETEAKRKATCMKKYGVDHHFKTDAVKERYKATNRERYGNDWAIGSELVQKKIRETLAKNGGEPFVRASSLEKRAETMVRKYGAAYTMQSETLKAKWYDGFRKKYGVDNPGLLYLLPEDKKAEFLEKYGIDCYHPYGKKYLYDDELFDSSWELAYWIWCKDNGKRIERNKKSFQLRSGGKTYVDFVVDGELVEVKSDYLATFDGFDEKEEVYRANGVTVLMKEEIEPVLRYVYDEYGHDYMKQFAFVKKDAPEDAS